MLLLLSVAPVFGQEQYELPVTTLTPRVDFSADKLEYDATGRGVTLTGNAEITDSTFTLRSEQLDVDLESQVFTAPVPFVLSDGSTTLQAGSGRFEFGKRVGGFDGLSGEFPPWSFSARKARVKGGRYSMRGAVVTSCDYEPPHYRIRSTHLTLMPNVRMFAWNNVFYLGKVPLLYLPFFYKSLKPHPWAVTKFHFGYDERNGAEIQSDTRIRINRHAYNRLYLDYYTRQGVGVGDEINYRRDDGSRGTVYAYRITEASGLTRWTVLGDFWQQLGGPYAAQGRLETLSDPDFNNAYFRSNQFRVSPELNNSVALVRQTFRGTSRISYARHDSRDPLDPLAFRQTSETLPRLDFNLAPIERFKVVHFFSAFGDRTQTIGRNFFKNTAGANWSASKTFNLRRDLTFVPTLGFSELYEDADADAFGDPVRVDRFTGRYNTQADLRGRWIAGDTTLGHRYTRRLAPNAFREDVTAADRGEEQNLATFAHSYLPSLQSRLALATGYDLRRDQRTALSDRTFKDRLQPIVMDAGWNPHYLWTFLAREVYRVGPGHQSILLVADYGLEGENRVGLSFSQNAFLPGTSQLGIRFGLIPQKSSWTIEGALRFELTGTGEVPDINVTALELFEKELSLRKVWHDFIGRLTFRERPGNVREFLVRVDLRIGNTDPDNRKQQWEEEFYPWRQGLQEK